MTSELEGRFRAVSVKICVRIQFFKLSISVRKRPDVFRAENSRGRQRAVYCSIFSEDN